MTLWLLPKLFRSRGSYAVLETSAAPCIPQNKAEDFEPSDSAMGNPSPAQVYALLGPELVEQVDWKNDKSVDELFAARRHHGRFHD